MALPNGTQRQPSRERTSKKTREIDKPKLCKHCGATFHSNDKRKVCCSRECGVEAIKGHRIARVRVECHVCGRQSERPVNRVREKNCCSDQCQKVSAARSLHRRMGTARKVFLPVLRKCECGKIVGQSGCNECQQWMNRLLSKAGEARAKAASAGWKEKLASIASNSTHRIPSDKPAIVHPGGAVGIDWTEFSWSDRMVSLGKRSKPKQRQSEWTMKMNNKASNARKRMKRKSQAGRLSG